jgi:GTP cyclohydrolase I
VTHEESPSRLIELHAGNGNGVPPVATLAGEAAADRPAVSSRRIGDADRLRFEGYVEEIFAALGMELGTPGTQRTPERFIEALIDATSGYDGDRKLLTTFPTESRRDAAGLVGQIVEGPMSFHALCEHHALPFHGFAHVGYIAGERIIGISKLIRLVRLYARRFTVQERLGEQIADELDGLVEPHGVAVHLETVHLCTRMRGVGEEHSRTATTVWRGCYAADPELRREFLNEVRNHNPWT